jgi:hypothetical protein
MIQDDLVLKFLLISGTAIDRSPAVATDIELVL